MQREMIGNSEVCIQTMKNDRRMNQAVQGEFGRRLLTVSGQPMDDHDSGWEVCLGEPPHRIGIEDFGIECQPSAIPQRQVRS